MASVHQGGTGSEVAAKEGVDSWDQAGQQRAQQRVGHVAKDKGHPREAVEGGREHETPPRELPCC